MSGMKRSHLARLLDRYRVTEGKGFKLKKYDTDDSGGDTLDKGEGERLLAEGVAKLSALQEKLYAEGQRALLCVLQARDAAGKDGTVKHVMSGVNPQGVQVTSFKQPGPTELAQDFLWRIHLRCPSRGHIGIFNRSHYEDVLVTRVHPELVKTLAPIKHNGDVAPKFWRHRLEDISSFERHLGREGTTVLKFFLNVSKAEQKRRFLDRLDEPDKHWKFSAGDLKERDYWDAYTEAYEDTIAGSATPEAPWFVVPADHKWFAHLIVVGAMIEALEAMDPQVPRVTAEQEEAIREARAKLEGE